MASEYTWLSIFDYLLYTVGLCVQFTSNDKHIFAWNEMGMTSHDLEVKLLGLCHSVDPGIGSCADVPKEACTGFYLEFLVWGAEDSESDVG